MKIGDLYWITENLKEDTTDSVWYNNDSSYEGLNFGKLYAQTSKGSVEELLHSGWRVATTSDFNNLGSHYSAAELSSKFGEDVFPNTSQFSAIGCGYYYDSFTNINQRTIWWASDSKWIGYNYTIQKQGPNSLVRWNGNDSPTIIRMKLSIRLCKDA